MTPDEENILSSIESYRATLEEIITFGNYSKKKSFDPHDHTTWPWFYRGLAASFEDCLKRVKEAINENEKNREKEKEKIQNDNKLSMFQ